MDAQIVGRKIAALRQMQKMTQQQLADILSVTNKAVSKWESGGGLPDIKLLPALADTLNVSIDELVSNEEKIKQRPKGSRSKIKKGIIIVATAVILVFGVYNAVWFYYVHSAFSPFLNEKTPSYTARERGLTITVFSDKESSYEIQVIKPSYLQFFAEPLAGVRIYQTFLHDGNYIELTITPVFRAGRIEYTFGLLLRKIGIADDRVLNMTVDKFGNPEDPMPDVSDEFFEVLMELYDFFYEDIIKLLSHARSNFEFL